SAIAVPAIILLIHFGGLPERAALFGRAKPRAGKTGFVVKLTGPQRVVFPRTGSFIVHGRRYVVAAGHEVTFPGDVAVRIPPYGIVPLAHGTPALTGEEWARPVGGTDHGSPRAVAPLR